MKPCFHVQNVSIVNLCFFLFEILYFVVLTIFLPIALLMFRMSFKYYYVYYYLKCLKVIFFKFIFLEKTGRLLTCISPLLRTIR